MLPDFLSDVLIEMGAVPSYLEGATFRGVLWQTSQDRFLLDVPDVSRYLVEDGNCITFDPSSRASDVDVQRFLYMAPLAALLFQRGILAFHAASICNEKGAILIAGDSGAGKSTLAAALLKRGCHLLSDELSVVDLNKDGSPVVFPILPEFELWSDSMEKLGFEHNGKGKHRLPVNDGFVSPPQQLTAIFKLSVHKNEFEVSSVEGVKIFHTLMSISYNSHIAEALLDRAVYMHQASAVARTVHLYNVKRPRGRWCLDELADLIEGECP
jgi:hypothetical protein